MHRVALLILGLGLFAAGLAAGEGPPLDRGWHVVRPGDTLEGITAYYLGSPARWRENWALNPGIKDPDLLHPGERLQVLVSPEHSRHAALLWRRARLVDSRQPPRDWTNAELGDLLVRRDGVRTGARSSAELAFTDGGRIWLTENSLVFLRATADAPRVAPSREVEIVSGRADLELTAPAARAAAVEVVMGPARASVRAAAGEGAQSRAARASGDEPERAALMVYRGEGELAAGGAKVSLPAGTGSVAAGGAPPAPPEKLLPAPVPVAPAAGEERGREALRFAWEEVAGAARYTLEVCADATCGQLVERYAALPAAPFQPAGELPLGELFWRVTPTSASGLDGYPSAATGFTLLAVEPLRDRNPPTGELVVSGPTWEAGERLFVRGDARIAAEVSDPEGSEISLAARLDDAPVALTRLAEPWEDGAHRLAVTATDAAGNQAELAPLAFVADGTPPALTWERSEAAGKGKRSWRWLARLTWSEPDRKWTTWKWVARSNYLDRSETPPLTWSAVAGQPELALTARRPVRLAGAVETRLGAGETIRLRFADAGAGLAQLAVSRRPAEGGNAWAPLRLTATDRLGNGATWWLEVLAP